MSSPAPALSPSALQDPSLRWALLLGAYLRLYPLARWPTLSCVRDECSYLTLGRALMEGKGVIAAEDGWLWAPAYPALLAAHGAVFGGMGGIRITQVILSLVTVVLAYRLAQGLAESPEEGRSAGRWAAWLFALSPTLVFFSGRLWSETLYLCVLLCALTALRWARQGGALRGALPGLLVGLCVLMRGVATYMLPLFAIGLLWRRLGQSRSWGQVLTLVLGAVLVVSPYSVHATQRWGVTTISDHTLGQMMWLGNNTFPPVTFDYGNGLTQARRYKMHTANGRPHCQFTGNPARWDQCELAAGKAWIRANPEEFLRRIPLRLSQLFNPNSFLTRHLGTGRWDGLYEPLGWLFCGLTVLWSGVAVLGGTAGLALRGRSWMSVVVGLILLYHCAAIALLAGLTRYRVPLDGLGLLWAALLLAAPARARAQGDTQPWRWVVLLLVLPLLAALMLAQLRVGFL